RKLTVMSVWRALFPVAAFPFIWLLGAGCAATTGIWQLADPRAKVENICAELNDDSGRPRAVVVRYQVGRLNPVGVYEGVQWYITAIITDTERQKWPTRFYSVVVPLDDLGWPVEPFRVGQGEHYTNNVWS